MKKFALPAFVGLLIIGFAAFSFFAPSVAQKKYVNQWEYAAITFTSIPANTENQAVIVGVANVCYFQTNGCQNEEIKAELIYAKFLQDFRLESTALSKNLAYNRARDSAYAKAVAKLGLEGWEIVGQPPFNLDAYVSDGQGAFAIVPGTKETRPNIYFKRLVQ